MFCYSREEEARMRQNAEIADRREMAAYSIICFVIVLVLAYVCLWLFGTGADYWQRNNAFDADMAAAQCGVFCLFGLVVGVFLAMLFFINMLIRVIFFMLMNEKHDWLDFGVWAAVTIFFALMGLFADDVNRIYTTHVFALQYTAVVCTVVAGWSAITSVFSLLGSYYGRGIMEYDPWM